MSLLEYQDLTLQGLEYEAKYSDYWNSTADDDGKCLRGNALYEFSELMAYQSTGQIVDAVIMPVAPHAGASRASRSDRGGRPARRSTSPVTRS